MAKNASDIQKERLARGQVRVAVWMTKEQSEQLKNGAEANDMTVSEAIRLSLEASGLIEAS